MIFKVPTIIYDRKGEPWSYQFGRMYADPRGRTLRHRDSIKRR